MEPMRILIGVCCLGVAATAAALPSNGERCGSDDGGTIVVCGTVTDHVNGSGGVGSAGSGAGPGSHGGSGGIRTTGPGGADTGPGDRPAEAPRPLSNQPEGCADCQAVFQEEMFRARSTRLACIEAGRRMATELCEVERIMPNGTLVEDYTCPGGGQRCTGPGIEQCKESYRRGMHGIAEGDGRNAGFSLPFTVPLSGGASRNETTSWNATTGYLIPCYQGGSLIEADAHNARTFCGRRVIAAQEGVCTF
jgi:hypothetical protein